MPLNEKAPDDWFSEEGLIAATGIGHFNLVRWRQQGLVPKPARRHLGFAVGTASFYPPITVPMIRRLDELRGQTHNVDAWFWGLWLDGYPIDIERWAGARLALLLKKASGLDNIAEINRLAAVAAGKSATRADPHRPLFRRLQKLDSRGSLLSAACAIGVGVEAAISFSDPNSPAWTALQTAAGLGGSALPDPEIDVEKMSLGRLRNILAGATVAEMEQARIDCKAITAAADTAERVDWYKARTELALPRQGGSNRPLARFECLLEIWRNFDVRAVILPFLIHLRREGYSQQLDEQLTDLALSLRLYTDLPQRLRENADIPEKARSSDHVREETRP